MKIKAKVKDCRLNIKVKVSSEYLVDQKELDRFFRVFLRGFLRPNLIKDNQIEYSGPAGISLQERLKKPISKRDFLFMLEQIIVAVQKLQANRFPLIGLVMDQQYTYVNEVTKEVQFIYMPLAQGHLGYNLVDFISNLAYVVPDEEERDPAFVSRFMQYLSSMHPFDINVLENFVMGEDRSVVSTIRKQNAGQSGFMTNKQKHYYDHQDQQQQNETAGIGSGPTGTAPAAPPPQTEVRNASYDYDVTRRQVYDISTGTPPSQPYADNDATGLLYDNRAVQGYGANTPPQNPTPQPYADNDATGLLYDNRAVQGYGANTPPQNHTPQPHTDNDATGLLYDNRAMQGYGTGTQASGIPPAGNIPPSTGVNNNGYSGYQGGYTVEETGGLYVDHNGGRQNQGNYPPNYYDTNYVEGDGSEETALLSDEKGYANPHPGVTPVRYPTLRRVLTGEIISVNKPVFRIGKERSYVDYFVANNAAVSRGHADVIVRGSKVFVKDLNSKNHTYINGYVLPPHYEAELSDGDRLVLGNEEFIFNK